MKAKKIIKIIIVCAGMMLFCIHPSTQAQEEYRDPFTNSKEEVFDKTLPSESTQATTSAGQQLKSAPSQGGNPLGIGEPVPLEDALWLLSVAAILYGVTRRKKINEEEKMIERESD